MTRTRILIVEDERTALQALSLHLEDEGYETLKADRGEAGLQIALQQEPDLILLDIRLPDVDGGVTRIHPDNVHDVPVIRGMHVHLIGEHVVEAARGSRKKFDRVLKKIRVGARAPIPGDEL